MKQRDCVVSSSSSSFASFASLASLASLASSSCSSTSFASSLFRDETNRFNFINRKKSQSGILTKSYRKGRPDTAILFPFIFNHFYFYSIDLFIYLSISSLKKTQQKNVITSIIIIAIIMIIFLILIGFD